MKSDRAIEIIGGGLAGLSLSLALRRSGIAVTVTEAGSYPRHRVCGEFITGLATTTRNRLGLDPLLADAVPNRNVAWFAADRPIGFQTLPTVAPSLSRHALDERLALHFVQAGGVLLTDQRSATEHDRPGRVFATGRRRARSTWLGLKVHAVSLPLARDLEFHLGHGAYLGLAKIEHGRVNICGLFERRALAGKGVDLLLAYARAAGMSVLEKRIRSAPLDAASFCAVAGMAFDRHLPALPEVRLGDACAMIPPFTGHGMAMAFQSAEIALDPLIAYARGEQDWPDTRQAIHTALRRRFQVRLASAGLLHSFLLQPARQRWFAILARARLLPFRPLYAALH